MLELFHGLDQRGDEIAVFDGLKAVDVFPHRFREDFLDFLGDDADGVGRFLEAFDLVVLIPAPVEFHAAQPVDFVQSVFDRLYVFLQTDIGFRSDAGGGGVVTVGVDANRSALDLNQAFVRRYRAEAVTGRADGGERVVGGQVDVGLVAEENSHRSCA